MYQVDLTHDEAKFKKRPEQYCVRGSNWSMNNPAEAIQYPHSARVVFDLPVSSDALYLFAQGSLAQGNITLLADPQEGGDQVKVEVIVSYYTQTALDRAKLCSLQRKSGENGIGIFVRDPQVCANSSLICYRPQHTGSTARKKTNYSSTL